MGGMVQQNFSFAHNTSTHNVQASTNVLEYPLCDTHGNGDPSMIRPCFNNPEHADERLSNSIMSR